jgi:hypothetical protein
VKDIRGEMFLAALKELKDDRSALLGAARLFFWEQLGERIAGEPRHEWTVRLAEIALKDGADENKHLVLRHHGACGDEGTALLLGEIKRGKKGTAIQKADSEEPGLRASAAVGLALRKVKDMKSEVEKLMGQAKDAPDQAALQVALALFGDADQLRAEHFKLHSYTIGLGAIRAIERFRGAHGLDLLVEKGMDHPWGAVREEAELAVQRITGQEWPERNREDAIKAWWKEHGAAFVQQQRKAPR